MIPRSLSASVLKVASGCLARYHSEYILKASTPANPAASLGTAAHAALEKYVQAVYINKSNPASLPALLSLFRMFYCAEFSTVEPDGDEFYQDGVEMMKRWFHRTSFENREVLSVETKSHFDLKTSAGIIPFNYIYDRLDQRTDEEDTYEITDYKTVRAAMSPRDLHSHTQARIYALAGQIQIPSAKKWWVRLDLLRHESVATVFTRAQNVATWNFIKAMAEKIIATSSTNLPETLNPECNFCIRKTSCATLQSNIAGGGVYAHSDLKELSDKRAKMEWQVKALKGAMAAIDELFLAAATEAEQLEFEGTLATVKVTQSNRQSVDAERLLPIVGSDLFAQYGGQTITIANYKKLLKDETLTPSQRAQLAGMAYTTAGLPYVKVIPRSSLEGD